MLHLLWSLSLNPAKFFPQGFKVISHILINFVLLQEYLKTGGFK